MNETTIEEIDSNIKEARKIIEVGNSLERLMNNRDFKKVVLEGYFKDEAIRLVHLKSDPNTQSEESQKLINTQMDSIGNFSSYLDMVFRKAGQAEMSIAADDETREELLAEEV